MPPALACFATAAWNYLNPSGPVCGSCPARAASILRTCGLSGRAARQGRACNDLSQLLKRGGAIASQRSADVGSWICKTYFAGQRDDIQGLMESVLQGYHVSASLRKIADADT